MANDVVDTLRQLLATGAISGQEADQLQLAALVEILAGLAELRSQQAQLQHDVAATAAANAAAVAQLAEIQMAHTAILARLELLEKYQRDYVPLMWYWKHQRWIVALGFVAVGWLYTLVFSPLNWSDLRHWIMQGIGLGDLIQP